MSPNTTDIPLHPLRSAPRSAIEYDRMAASEDSTLLDSYGSSSHHYHPKRPSKRLWLVHVLHGLFVALSAVLFVASLGHWEHRIGITLSRVSEVASYISVGFQIFFTGCTLLLLALSSSIAIDAAIRHPRTLVDLDTRLYAWSGLGSSVAIVYKEISRITSLPLSVSLGIPLYFAAGEVLKVTASTVLGVAIFNSTTISVSPNAASNHLAPMMYPGLKHSDYNPHQLNECDMMNPGKQMGLWKAARTSMFIPALNNTLRPGIQGRILHDTPAAMDNTYDVAYVNSTRMSVECSQVEDSFVEFFMAPAGTESTFIPDGYRQGSWESGPFPVDSNYTEVLIHADEAGYTIDDESSPRGSEIWLNISIPGLPPYWKNFWGPDSTGRLDFSFSRPIDRYSSSNSTLLIFQPWGYLHPRHAIKAGPGRPVDVDLHETGLSHQIVFSLSSSNKSVLLADAQGSQGNVHTVRAIFKECANCTTSSSSEACYDQSSTDCKTSRYVQVLGCTLRTSGETLAITPLGQLAALDTNKEYLPKPHEWASFAWEDPNGSVDFVAKEFLTMLSPTACEPSLVTNMNEPGFAGYRYRQRDTAFMADLLVEGLAGNGSTVQNLENMLELLTASYIWNVQQLCSSPPYGTAYLQCNQSAVIENPQRMNTATFVTTVPKARLEIVRWRAAVTAVCSVILLILAFLLLGTTTDLPKGEELREARFMEHVKLMKDSNLPSVVDGRADVANTLKLRYGPRDTGGGSKIDVAG